MNANRIFNMVLHQVMRRLIGRGVNAGIDRMTRGGARAEGEQDRSARPRSGKRQRAGSTKQAMRVARRMGRF